ncbi:hypothetical protein D3C73_1289240 [compost metagenome]
MTQHKETTAHGLDRAEQQEGQVVRRQCATYRPQDRQRDTAEQDFLTPPFIRERACDQLGDRKDQREQTDGERDVRGRRVELGGQGGERGQENIDREEADQRNAGNEDESGELLALYVATEWGRAGGLRHCCYFPE